jgi:hypothetical protein
VIEGGEELCRTFETGHPIGFGRERLAQDFELQIRPPDVAHADLPSFEVTR